MGENKKYNQSAEWPWDKDDDAVEKAPDSHRILFENERFRVLQVTILPGKKEPFHTHEYPSKMTVLVSTDINYYDSVGRATFYPEKQTPFEEELGPEGLHAVENLDPEKTYYGIRIEDKANQ